VKAQANPEKAIHAQRFFKTGPGEYGEGDLFLGLSNPQVRAIVKAFKKELHLTDLATLINNKYHEIRLTGLLLLVELFKQAEKNSAQQKKIVDYYLAHSDVVNNWDLVDLTAHKILGAYLFKYEAQKIPQILIKLAKSSQLWERRIAVISTFAYIRQGVFEPTIKLATMLLNDQEDLMHKAVGWTLREVGKHDQAVLENFLHQHKNEMPRTMLRYSIERLSPEKRQFYLSKN